MELDIQYNADLKYVEVIAVGALTTENIAEASRQTRELAQKEQCKDLLIDIRQCTVIRSMMEGFMDMENYMELTGLDYQYKCAVLYDPTSYPVERATFIEAVVRNRPNPRFRMFSERDTAVAWLLE